MYTLYQIYMRYYYTYIKKLEWSIIVDKLKLVVWKIRTICQHHHLSTPSRNSVLVVTVFW